VDVGGDVVDVASVPQPLEDVVRELRQRAPGLDLQAAIDIAEVLERARRDPETSLLLLRLRGGGGREDFVKFKESMSEKEIILSLRNALEEMKSVEVLYEKRTPAAVVEEMYGDGLVPEDKLSEYRKNPTQLEEDTRKSLYFTFVSLAAAGGYL
jgi:hypothetical protein